MEHLDEIATLCLHSKLIQDTGRIFLDIDNYEKQGFLIRQEYLAAVRSSRRIPIMPLAITAPLAIVMLGILIMQYFSRNQDLEKQDPLIVKQIRVPDKLEDKIQIFFPEQTPFVAASMSPETELASTYRNYDQDSPSPEEIAYVSAFRSFLEKHLRSKGFIFPKPEELNRTCQLPHAWYADFTIDEKGNVQLKGSGTYPIPSCVQRIGEWIDSVNNYYNQLFRDMPKFVSPIDYKLKAPYIIDTVGIFNALTRDGNRVYWFKYEYEKLFQDFDLGKLKVITPIHIRKN